MEINQPLVEKLKKFTHLYFDKHLNLSSIGGGDYSVLSTKLFQFKLSIKLTNRKDA